MRVYLKLSTAERRYRFVQQGTQARDALQVSVITEPYVATGWRFAEIEARKTCIGIAERAWQDREARTLRAHVGLRVAIIAAENDLRPGQHALHPSHIG